MIRHRVNHPVSVVYEVLPVEVIPASPPREFVRTKDKVLASKNRSNSSGPLLPFYADGVYHNRSCYEEKLHALEEEYGTLMQSLWSHITGPDRRVAFTEIVSYVVTSTELFAFISDVAFEEDVKVPMGIIDNFEIHVSKTKDVIKNGKVKLENFAKLLDFRDDIVKHMQWTYRFKQVEKDRDHRDAFDRYCPYDNDWLCGSIISGDVKTNDTTCAMYQMLSRMTQINNTHERLEILAAFDGTDITDNDSIRLPIPNLPKNADCLLNGLRSRESVMENVNSKAFAALEEEYSNTSEFEFIRIHADLVTLQVDIRKKKKVLALMAPASDESKCVAIHMIIGILSILETQLLISQSAYAPFVDKKHGIYGVVFPRDIYQLAAKIHSMTTLSTCTGLPLDPSIEEELDNLRSKVREFSKKFYSEHEANCEKTYAGRIEICPAFEDRYLCFPLVPSYFPQDMLERATIMIKHLHWEHFDQDRLNFQLHVVRQGRFFWPDNLPDLCFNVYDDIVAFTSNFTDVMPSCFVERVLHELSPPWHIYSFYHFAGAEIVRHIHKVIVQQKSVPSDAAILAEMRTTFNEIFGNTLIYGRRANQLARDISNIVKEEIEGYDYRNEYGDRKPAVARLIALSIALSLDYSYRQLQGRQDLCEVIPEESADVPRNRIRVERKEYLKLYPTSNGCKHITRDTIRVVKVLYKPGKKCKETSCTGHDNSTPYLLLHPNLARLPILPKTFIN
uniref:Peptidase_M13_N domain-containing protein n=1 Tax=Caenorhabditis tropicalis TaxID=1561998 RepID=A0A1I7TJ89_9PELO